MPGTVNTSTEEPGASARGLIPTSRTCAARESPAHRRSHAPGGRKSLPDHRISPRSGAAWDAAGPAAWRTGRGAVGAGRGPANAGTRRGTRGPGQDPAACVPSHAFTTAVLDASGGNLLIARDAGGWASTAVVDEIYAHVDVHDAAFDAALRKVWGESRGGGRTPCARCWPGGLSGPGGTGWRSWPR